MIERHLDIDPIKFEYIKEKMAKFDSPSVQVPFYKLTPLNSKNTLFSFEAFWALYLPKTAPQGQ